MNVASLELCRELHELSGWDSDEPDRLWWGLVAGDYEPIWLDSGDYGWTAPAYNLGYLLRKLNQARITGRIPMRLTMDANSVGYSFGYEDYLQTTHEEQPEDAACLLAIELFKQGILTNTNSKGEDNE